MRNFNMLAAVAAALLMSGGAFAKEKAAQPKPKKVCRSEQLSGRITPTRVCRVVPPSETPAEDDRRKSDTSREAEDGRD